jgi:hypothetical protein
MDRAFSLNRAPDQVWPWLVQLGKKRAGWYFPASVERWLPRSHRAMRVIDPTWQQLSTGDVIPDYGGPRASFTVEAIEAPHVIVYSSTRGHTAISWTITLTSPPGSSSNTRVHLRLRLGGVKHVRLAGSLGGFIDLVTIAGMAAGLRERLRSR